jgi:hypothetical protein
MLHVIQLVLESIDWQCLIGFICAELLILFGKSIEGWRLNHVLRLPRPRVDCIDRGEPPHWVRHDAWDVGDGHVRHP